MHRSLNRRTFLRGLGGACVAAPFLGSLAERRVKAQAESPAPRLIAMFTHYGCITTRFFPTKSHGALTSADLEPTTLSPLAPYVDKLLIPRGIRAMNEWTATLARGQGNDPHIQVVSSYFTCQPVTPNSNDPFSFNQNSKFAPRPVGPSLDNVMAQQLSPNGTPLFMRVANVLDGATSAISFSAAETQFPGLGAPSQVYSVLTGLFADGAPMSPDSYAAVRGKSVIDLVREDLDTLERANMSGADRRKLENWKELLDQTGTMVAAAQCSQDGATRLGVTQANMDALKGTLGADVLTTKITDSMDGADLYSNFAALAAVCNANPVIVLKYPANYIFKGLGLSIEAHALSHRLDNAGMSGTCLDGVIDMLLTIDGYYASKFAYLVGLLESIQEGDGTVLDNTAAVWFQEMSDGNAHNLNNLPIIQAGSAGGYFKTGFTINVENGAADLTRGNSESTCTPDTSNMVNGTTQSTGTDPAVSNAPINKYYYNLMNALGVKAGDDGFPLVGGAAEVTKFGMYDKTEDFIGGGTNPPIIHSPGAYDALKANS
jgi:hypothetical protein